MRRILLSLALLAALLVPTLSSTPASAALFSGAKDNACKGANVSDSAATCADGETAINKAVTTAVNILSLIVGLVAVVMIIYGGFLYVTAAGETAKLTTARHTIMYAIIGLVIAALAQVVVRFVLGVTS